MFRDGFLTEGSSSNVFAVRNGTILATPKNNPIPEAEVRAADEIWVTSSTKEVLAVTTLDGKPVASGKPGAVFRRMHQLYQDFKRTVMRQAA